MKLSSKTQGRRVAHPKYGVLDIKKVGKKEVEALNLAKQPVVLPRDGKDSKWVVLGTTEWFEEEF